MRTYFLNDALVVFISTRNIFSNFWDTKEKEVRIECYIDKSRIFCSIHNFQNNFLHSTILYFVVQVFCEWNNFFDNYFYLRQICNPSCRVFICIFKRCIHVNWKTAAKWSLKYLKCILRISHSKYLQKFAYFLKSSLLLNSFFVFSVCKQTSYGWITWKLKKLLMQNFQSLLLKLKQSFICCYIICITVTLSKITYCIVNMSQLHSYLYCKRVWK